MNDLSEDIKILERNLKNGIIYVNCGNNIEKALENLIKGYRELEDRYLKNRQRTIKLESKIKEKIEEINSELEEKYSAEKISVFSGNTYMEKFKLLGKLQALQELMEDK